MPCAQSLRRRGASSACLRIGYLGGDFFHHSTSFLLAGVLRAHDRSAVHVTILDSSPDDGSDARKNMLAAADTVLQLGELGPVEAAQAIRRLGTDILVDTKGYTSNTRSEILLYRPAPLQVSYLGYVCSQGGSWTDYVIADEVVLPLAEQDNWTESIVHLPFCYFPNGQNRPLPPNGTQSLRATHGLPEGTFILGCFSAAYKLTRAMVTAWAQILKRCPSALLWLYAENEVVAANIRRVLDAEGVHPGRCVYAQPLAHAEHLQRLACIDLLLDTYPYGAHTTAADALWAGVPVLALRGRSFASRVSSSMVTSSGMPDMIANSLEDFVDKSCSIIRDTAWHRSLRTRADRARDVSPLFKPEMHARALEAAYRQMAEIQIAGLSPRPITVPNDVACSNPVSLSS